MLAMFARFHLRQFLLGASAALALVGSAAQLHADGPRHGGTVTMVIETEPPVITTIAHTAANSVLISGKVTEGLLTYGFDLEPLPQLATAWEVSDDGLVYRFELRKGVRWHDGKPFTSADAAHSIALLREFHPRGRATFSAVEAIETPDDHTLVLRLGHPAPFLIGALSGGESPIVPKHLYLDGAADANPVNNAPVGTGPFVFKEWQRGSHLTFERNPDYWDQPKPYLDRVVVRFIPDVAARTVAIETGEINLAPGTPVALAEVDRVKALPGLTFTTEGYRYQNSVWRLEFNLERPVFQNVRVRQAFAHAIDRDVLIDTAFYGHGQHTPGFVNPNLERFFVADIAPPDFDPARAEALLDEAGYPRDADGVRLRVTHDFMPTEGSRRGAEYFRQALAAIGVEVELRAQDFPTYVKRVYTDRDFDFNFGGMSNTFDPTVGIQRLYWSKNFKPGLPFSNGSGYSNPEVDALLEAAAIELDPDKRVTQWAEIQRIVARDLPDLTLIAPDSYTLASSRLVDHTVTFDGAAGNLASAYFKE
jgi:peptide/nickel transport system substrate-binding protein